MDQLTPDMIAEMLREMYPDAHSVTIEVTFYGHDIKETYPDAIPGQASYMQLNGEWRPRRERKIEPLERRRINLEEGE